MGLCGAKRQALDTTSTPTSRKVSYSPPLKVKEEVLLEWSIEAAAPELASCTVPSSKRGLSGLETLAKDSSQWRPRLVSENHTRIADYYRLEEHKLGEGSYGFVCKGIHRKTGRASAVKCLEKGDIRYRRTFNRQEIAIMKTVDHPNIIRLTETFEDKEHIFLILELCRGGSLYDHLAADGPFPEARAAATMQQILRAVFYIHERQICHRDLKLDHFLFLTEDRREQDTLKLIDFGFACTLEPGISLSMKLGTPCYCSPQVLKGSYDQLCDLWSCGVVMYTILSGHMPFSGRNDDQVIQLVRHGNYCFGAPVWSAISGDAKDLIRMLLKYLPEERHTAEQALAHCWIKHWLPEAGNASELAPSVLANLLGLCSQHRLRQAASQVLAQQLPEEDIRVFREAFAALDTRGNGLLAVAELRKCLQNHSLEGVPEDMRQVLQELASESVADAVIGYTDFLAAMLGSRHCLNEDACLAAFCIFDRNRDDHISQDDLQVLFASSATTVDDASATEIANILQQVDANNDGLIDFQEFKQMLAGDLVRAPRGVQLASAPSTLPGGAQM